MKLTLNEAEEGIISPLAPAGGFPDLPIIDGVEFAAAEAAVKYAGRLDLMMARIAPESVVAGLFTRSSTRAAPVLDCQAKLSRPQENGKGFALVVNSGNANAFTGAAGVKAVNTVVGAVAEKTGIPRENVLCASTGVIGEPLPHEKITVALDRLIADLDPKNAGRAARAIMTTDTFAKGAHSSVSIDGREVRIAGFAKGSGMIAPDMATMLVFIFTDALIAPEVMKPMVTRLNSKTFNCITVDSDTSTSDSLIVAATGRSGVDIGPPGTKANRVFSKALGEVMKSLAHQVVRDGEGATKFLEITVTGAINARDAKKVAMSIANSPLVKTAVAGEDPNWGRVVMAVGKSGARADRDLLSIRFGDVLVAENGQVSPDYREEDGAACMKNPEVRIAVDLGLGKGCATVWTCDLTRQYIAINADYRS